MTTRPQRRETGFRPVAALLALTWLTGGGASLALAFAEQRWLFAIAGVAALWYGWIWLGAYRRGRLLTAREALTPWRAN